MDGPVLINLPSSHNIYISYILAIFVFQVFLQFFLRKSYPCYGKYLNHNVVLIFFIIWLLVFVLMDGLVPINFLLSVHNKNLSYTLAIVSYKFPSIKWGEAICAMAYILNTHLKPIDDFVVVNVCLVFPWLFKVKWFIAWQKSELHICLFGPVLSNWFCSCQTH